ncbi:zinc-binding dehydrogenase [Alphaproteobacteria bacterium]|nr:zinc-binding dehydrogenase [Alphaproteobacteria bacterium]
MKAIYYTETGNAKSVLKLGTFDDPIPKKNQVILKVDFSSVNPADTKKRSGWISRKLNERFVIPHSDGCGEVVDVFNNKDKHFVGNKFWICGGSKENFLGTCAEFFATDKDNLVHLPKNLSLSESSCLGVPVATAYFSIFSEYSKNEKFIFISGGAGAVSNYAIQFAKLQGLKVITTVSSNFKKEMCKRIGADLILNYKKLTQQEIIKSIYEFTKGKLVDRCVEVDFGYNISLLPKILKNNGILCSYSSSSILKPNFPYYLYAAKGINIKIVQAFLHDKKFLKKIGLFTNSLINKEKLRHPIIKSFDFSKTHQAHDYIEHPKKIGKSNILIKI